MGRGNQSSSGNLQSNLMRAHGGDSAFRATMASMYAAVEAAPVNARNSDVVVRLGSDESSSSSSSDSESSGNSACSDPYSEPSPPKSIPKPWASNQKVYGGNAFAKTRFSASFVKPTTAKVVIHEEKMRGEEVKPANATTTNRFGFSPTASAMSFSSSLCTTEGTASLNSSSSSVKIGGAANTDDGKLSVAHLTTCDEEAEPSEVTSELPPKLTFTLKPVTEALPTMETKPTATAINTTSSEVTSTPSEPAPALTTPHFAFDIPTPISLSGSHPPRTSSGRIVLKARRASLPGSKTAAKSITSATAGLCCTCTSQSRAASAPLLSAISVDPKVSEDSSPRGTTSNPAINSTAVLRTANSTSPSVDNKSHVAKEAYTRPSTKIVSSPTDAVIHGVTSVVSTHSVKNSTPSSASPHRSVHWSGDTNCKTSTPTFAVGDVSSSIRNDISNPGLSTHFDATTRVRPSNIETSSAIGEQNATSTKQSTPSKTTPSAGFTSSFGLSGSSVKNEPQLPHIPCAGFSFGLSGDFAAHSVFGARTTLNSIVLEISGASLIASGRTGTIYKAVSGVSTLAVKVVNKPVGIKASSRFERELITLRKLPDHECLVRHHGYMSLTDGDKVGVITDMVIGSQTLHGRLHSELSLLDERGKHRALLQISDALAFLHSHGVTHRDLSLKHVLHSFGSPPGSIKLIDFGLPTLRTSKSIENGLPVSPWVGVTPEYASPEVLCGELSFHDNDGWMKSDIFSFAVLMVELLNEELPWDGESPVYIANAVLKRGERAFDIEGVHLFGKKSPALDAIIQDAWHEDPSRRPSAKDVHMKLESLFAHGQEGNVPESYRDPFARIAKIFQLQDPAVEHLQAAAATSPCGVVESVTTPNLPGSRTRSGGLDTSATPTQATEGPGQIHSTKGSGAPVSSPTAFGFSFGFAPTAEPSSSFTFGTATASLFSPPIQEDTSSVQRPGRASVGSTGSLFRLPQMPKLSSVYTFPSSSPYSSLPGLTLTISDKTRITAGSRGPVYRASYREGQIAVEVVNKPKTRNARLSLDKEIIALKNIPDHPHLVRHYGSTPTGDGNQCGIITDLVFGAESIEARLHRAACRIGEVDKHRMLLQIVDAMSFLHAHGITHRNLSLRHVLNTYDSPPSIKLANFGLPTLRGTTVSENASPSDSLMGSTLEYASPEALRGELSNREDEGWEKSNGGWTVRKSCSTEGKRSWRESDVYSFAVLLMEMLLEEKPWDGELPMYVMNAVAKQGRRPFRVEDVRVFGNKCPALELLIQEAWHDDPAKRPSADRLMIRLERIFKAN